MRGSSAKGEGVTCRTGFDKPTQKLHEERELKLKYCSTHGGSCMKCGAAIRQCFLRVYAVFICSFFTDVLEGTRYCAITTDG